MSTRGAEFGKVAPIETNALLRVGGKTATRRIDLGNDPNTLENGVIRSVSPEGAFRPGQQILFYLTVYNGPVAGGQFPGYISRVRLKPWFKRVSLEQRGPGDPGNNESLLSTPTSFGNAGNGWVRPDEEQYGSGPTALLGPLSSGRAGNNRLVWFPVPKILDVTQYQSPNPPPVAPARHSDSVFLDDVWTLDLQDPAGAAYAATKGTSQPNFGRSTAFLYISHGTALGLTHQIEVTGAVAAAPSLFIDLTWVVGTTE